MVKHDSVTDDSSGAQAVSVDPFNQRPKDHSTILRKRINTARADGSLNLAAMDLKSIPQEVLNMYEAESMADSDIPWHETVDLSRLIAADNLLEEILDEVFPDIDVRSLSISDIAPKSPFLGLELLDLHGNSLQSLPIGIRRLERLTCLNLVRY